MGLQYRVFSTLLCNSGRRSYRESKTSSSAIAERPPCRVGQLRTKVEEWNWETIFTDIIGLYSTTETYLTSKAIESGEKRKIKAISRSRSFKVIEVGTNLKHVCDFVLVINSNWQHILYGCGVIAAYCCNFEHLRFEPLFGGSGTMYDVHLGLIGKRVVDFLLVKIELFR